MGAFTLSNSNRFMNKFAREINGYYIITVCYTDTDSLYIERKYWNVLNKTELFANGSCQGKNDCILIKLSSLGCFKLPKEIRINYR